MPYVTCTCTIHVHAHIYAMCGVHYIYMCIQCSCTYGVEVIVMCRLVVGTIHMYVHVVGLSISVLSLSSSVFCLGNRDSCKCKYGVQCLKTVWHFGKFVRVHVHVYTYVLSMQII